MSDSLHLNGSELRQLAEDRGVTLGGVLELGDHKFHFCEDEGGRSFMQAIVTRKTEPQPPLAA